jgi:hypothetical protein
MDACYGHLRVRERSAAASITCADVASTTHPEHVGTVRTMPRQCSRTGCAAPADATLTYQYGRSLVWLDELAPERDPHSYDLCERHAGRLSVPQGWILENRRSVRDLVGVGAHRLAG